MDDVEANLVALDALLRGLDCEVVLASGGNDGLRQLLKREFACMLLDVQMPGMDGYEVAGFARQNPATRDVPIIFLTANYNTEEAMLRGYGTGAVDYLFKPVNGHVLRAKVRIFLDLYLERCRLANEVAAHRATLSSLEEANTALRHFTHAASHDLKAPLRAISGFSQALSEHLEGRLDSTGRDYIARVLRANARMESLLSSLLQYAKLERRRPFADVDCTEIAEQAKADLADRLAATRATVRIDALPTVRGDPSRLYQLFLNLIANANEFRRAQVEPNIVVSSASNELEWHFCVQDNGIGIAPEHRTVIFEAFRRLRTNGSVQGTGLGLVICRQIVEQHGGRIWVESEVGRGSRFLFSIPITHSS